MATPLYPANDFGMTVKLKEINAATGKAEALLSGTVTAFISETATPDATAVPGITVNCTHITGDTAGKWTLLFDALMLDYTTLEALATDTLYLHVVKTGSVHVVETLSYTATRAAEIDV